jgi:hypothetical protein
MKFSRRLAALIFVGFGVTGSLPAYAMLLMDAPGEEVLKQSAEIRLRLNLTANQQVLWQQVESRTREMVRERRARRERLQAELKSSLDDRKIELRDLAKKIDAEEELGSQEIRKIRELWLTLDDALDDTQRQVAHAFLREQIDRFDQIKESPKESSMKPEGEAKKESRGGRMPRGGGMGGSSRF